MLAKAGHAVESGAPDGIPAGEPVRTCVGCRERAARSDLLRVVLAPGEGDLRVVPDTGHRLPGRGAHLHPDPRCFETARRRRAFTRALRRGGQLDLAPVLEHLTGTSTSTSTAISTATDRERVPTPMSTR